MFQKTGNPEIKREYTRCLNALEHSGIITLLPKSGNKGVFGIDGKEYPVPDLEEVYEIFSVNKKLIDKKTSQGFNQLVLTPLAAPLQTLFNLLGTALVKYGEKGKIYQTRYATSDPLTSVRVNKDRQVWVWDTLKQAIDNNELVYFPAEYSERHSGLSKSDVINNRSLCAVPGWSVGLVENLPFLAGQGQGKTLGGRKQLEIGNSPNEYLDIMRSEEYEGETGKTLEDFIIDFIIHLDATGEVSHDMDDDNALWCLGQYFRVPYADLVPTGRWFRKVGRVRLDLHRTNNKKCTRSWGASTTVRLIS